MKKMTCRQLGGACDVEFHGDTFEEIAELSKKHGMEMFRMGEENHLKAMEEMKELMNDPKAMKKWYESKKKAFEELEEE